MAAHNRLLGKFDLTNIVPAPRGVPQIEVTFDIDSNGILNVSAKDKGTGKEQKIKIESSSGLSEDEINKMIKDAEANAEADKKAKEKVEIKNQGEQIVFQTEKSLKEMGENIPEDAKKPVEDAIAELKKAIESDDTANIQKGIDKVSQAASAFYQAAQAAQAAAQAAAAQQSNTGGEATTEKAAESATAEEADFEVVDDDDKKE
jgi:molecular chaperone DnaK